MIENDTYKANIVILEQPLKTNEISLKAINELHSLLKKTIEYTKSRVKKSGVE